MQHTMMMKGSKPTVAGSRRSGSTAPAVPQQCPVHGAVRGPAATSSAPSVMRASVLAKADLNGTSTVVASIKDQTDLNAR